MKVEIGAKITHQARIDDAPNVYTVCYRTEAGKVINTVGSLHYLFATDYRVLTLEAEEQFASLTEQIKNLKEQRRAIFEALERAE